MAFLGIDASNYTTSAAILSGGEIFQRKAPLPVPKGDVGLRQSDAVFAHVKQLGRLLESLFADCPDAVSAVGVSVTPRDAEGSYMPCFLAGEMCARSVAAALRVPLYTFSHQAGHIAAALYGAKAMKLFGGEFLAFHISGGTTRCELVRPGGDKPFEITDVSRSMDLHAGQLIDRVGAMLGLGFPAGPELEKLALESEKDFPVKITFKGLNPCLSGVQNQCERLIVKGEKPCDTAKFCIDSVMGAVMGMTERAAAHYPEHTLVYAGGVMSSVIIRRGIEEKYGGLAVFAPAEFSADNAAGIAVLCEKSYGRGDAL